MSIEPCGHVPIYKPIEMRPVRTPEPPEPVNARAERIRSAEADRIWAIIRHTAQGCNQPTRPRSNADHAVRAATRRSGASGD
jgi:hypothetical protein